MTSEIRLTILGLGPVGASLGLALGQADLPTPLRRVGHDPDPLRARAARQAGAIDQVALTLGGAVDGADFVVLALPPEETRKTLETIGPLLRPDAVVFDTLPAHAAAAHWAAHALPPGRHYLGLVPVCNPRHLHAADEPRADYFHNAVMGIIATPDTPAEALRLAADLCTLLGATPLFLDPTEADGLLAAVEVLPQLLAAALLHTAAAEPGWREARKFAGAAFARGTQTEHAPADLAALALAHRTTLPHLLDRLQRQMAALSAWLAAEDAAALTAWLEQAAATRTTWWEDRQRNRWETPPRAEMPTVGENLGRLLGLRRPKRPPHQEP